MPRTIIFRLLFSLLATFSFVSAKAQTTIRGRVVDKETGNPVIGASVYLEDFTDGSFTDFDGFFQFTTKSQGQTNLVATSMGYEKVSKYISLSINVLTLKVTKSLKFYINYFK